MKRGKNLYLIFILGIFLIGIASSANYCCEKTTSGAWCQDVTSKSECDSNFRSISSYCESTSYCKTGTCIDQKEGTCKTSTQAVCENNAGFWSNQDSVDLPQCKLGCCLIGDNAAFVTQVTCNRMSALYGFNVNFDASINKELDCLSSANPQAKGACVYTKNYARTCEMTTRTDCQNTIAKNSAYSNVSFNEGYLCSAQSLSSGCAKSKSTVCNKDSVYFVDTCGNLANVYDSSKINDESYWTTIQNPKCTSTNDLGNKDAKDATKCGECDYYSGSMCQQKKAGDSVDYGNYLCKDLDCKDYRGQYSGSSTGFATATNYPKHGETWCSTDSKSGGTANSPGATSFKLICYNGQVTNEECDPTRQKVCSETTSATGFKTASCKVNVWEDCYSQTTKEDCEDINTRDCTWQASNGYSFSPDFASGLQNTGASGICLPKYQLGFLRDGSSDASANCVGASTVCYVRMEKGLFASDYSCKPDINPNLFNLWTSFHNNCSCLDASWKTNLNNICVKLGDCGTKTNYIGEAGAVQKDIMKIVTG